MPPLRFLHLPTLESNFKTLNAARLEHIQYTPELEVLLYKSPNAYHYNEVHTKKRIVLHFTAGSIEGDILTMTKADSFISVPFVIARDGTIYQLFSSRHWAYSLGMKASDGDNANHKLHKSCIAIELSNIGPLELKADGNTLRRAKQKSTDPNIDYCTLDMKEAYVKLDSPFRGYTYYASYPEAQMKSLAILVKWLSARYTIPLEILHESVRYNWDIPSQTFAGITSHINYRKEGKWDIGPAAFDWEKFKKDITGTGATRSRGGTKTREAGVEIDTKLEGKILKGKVSGVKYGEGVEEEL